MTTYEREIYYIITGSVKHLTVEQIYAEMKNKYPKIALAYCIQQCKQALESWKDS